MRKVAAVLSVFSAVVLLSGSAAQADQLRPGHWWSCTVQGKIGDLFKTFDGYGQSLAAAKANGIQACKASRYHELCYVRECRPGL